MSEMKKRKDGRYQKNVFIGRDSTGKRKFKTVYGYSKAEVDRNCAEILSSLTKGIYANDEGYTVKGYALEWVDIYKKELAESTYKGYKNIINNHCSSIADIRLKDLKKTDLKKI